MHLPDDFERQSARQIQTWKYIFTTSWSAAIKERTLDQTNFKSDIEIEKFSFIWCCPQMNFYFLLVSGFSSAEFLAALPSQ